MTTQTTNTPLLASEDLIEEVREQTTGVRFKKRAPQSRRAMTEDQERRVADLFHSNRDDIGGDRQVLPKRHPLLKPIKQIQNQASAYIQSISIEFPEPGIRLMRLDQIEEVEEQIQRRSQDLSEALEALYLGWDEIIEDRRKNLQELFLAEDYAFDPRTKWGIEVSYPTIAPDARIARIDPALYLRHCERLEAAYEAALSRLEADSITAMKDLLEGFAERLSPKEDGTPKVMRTSVLANIEEVASRFSLFQVGQNTELDKLLANVRQMAQGISPEDLSLNKSANRQKILEKVQESLASVSNYIEARPIREIEF